MTDSSFQRPSDPAGNPESGDDSPQTAEEQNKAKLKLKQLLTPLSPHLKVDSHKADHRFEEFKPRMEIPRAVPTDPEPELAPHERPPSPDGAPLTPGEGQWGPDGLPMPTHGMPHPSTHEGRVSPTSSDSENDGEEEEIEKLVSAPARQPGKFKKIALPAVGLLIVLAAVQYFLDPLGLSIEPITPGDPIVLAEPAASLPKEEMPASIAPVSLSLELDRITVESFVELLEKQVIISSERPRGAIIDSVFYSEGNTLNPQLGLVLSSVKDDSITITDGTGRQYELPVN